MCHRQYLHRFGSLPIQNRIRKPLQALAPDIWRFLYRVPVRCLKNRTDRGLELGEEAVTKSRAL